MKDNYSWEVELKDGVIIKKGNEYPPEEVVRVSFIPQNVLLPRHDIIFTDFIFIQRFGRGFIKQGVGVKEYLHCVVTNKFRFYLKSSSGNVLITEPNYELYI